MTSSSSRLPRFFSVDEIADELKVSTKTVRRWIERGELHVHHLGRQLRVSEEDLIAFINKHQSGAQRRPTISGSFCTDVIA